MNYFLKNVEASISKVSSSVKIFEFSPKHRTSVCVSVHRLPVSATSSTGIDGGPLPVEQPANYPPTSLSSAPVPKVLQKSCHSTRMFRRIHHLSFSFQHLRFSFHDVDVRRVFRSQCQRYCERSFYINDSFSSTIFSCFYYCIKVYLKYYIMNVYYLAIYYSSRILNLPVKRRIKKKQKIIAKCYLKRFIIYIYIYIYIYIILRVVSCSSFEI